MNCGETGRAPVEIARELADSRRGGSAWKAATVQSIAMAKRRYGDQEVREIFSLATTGGMRDGSLPAESGGLTLDELQRIGQEAGIEPARVAQAAERLDRSHKRRSSSTHAGHRRPSGDRSDSRSEFRAWSSFRAPRRIGSGSN